ncbi:hypothetical protein B1H10_00625 [candidate division KSB1 bacterium 4484_188]|nr:MAG: hypothetical protein B1H10_00625 [candidate division KSB1 bacterium 4484_188]
MKKRLFIFHPIFVFIVAQIAWLSLVGLWIYWYVSNYIIIKQVGKSLSPQLISKGTHVGALVWGLILLVLLLGGMYFIFIYLAKQINITRLYDSFIANITHELKSPLSSIQLYLETLRSRKVPAEKQKEFLELMMKDSQRLKNLIDSILDIAAIEQKKTTYTYRVSKVENVVREIVAGAREQFKLSEDALILEGHASCQWVVDRNAIKTVFDNLIDNAIKYTAGTFHLIIRMSHTNKKIIAEFIDRGIGIEPGKRKKIFHKFYRIPGRNIPSIQGTGLGLYIVREIIKSHGGKISVMSNGVEKGTTFRIELPVYPVAKKRFVNRLLQKTKKAEEQ